MAVGGDARVVRVLGGVAAGARLELDLSREKAYWTGRYERGVQRVLRESLTSDDVVYDVGAHHGFFSVCAARLGARVFAFEPSHGNAERIRRNATLNGLPIDVLEVGVWSSDAGVALEPGDSDFEFRTISGSGCASITLDAFSAHHPRPTFLKIDAEGAEAHVLRGARELLEEAPPTIVCEVHSPVLREEVRELLGDRFDVQPLDSEWRLLGVPRETTG